MARSRPGRPPESLIESDEVDGESSLDHSRRYWNWATTVALADHATITPQQGVDKLAAHLADKGWTVGTPTPLDPVNTDIRIDHDYGSWLVEIAPVQHTIDITVMSPVTTKD